MKVFVSSKPTTFSCQDQRGRASTLRAGTQRGSAPHHARAPPGPPLAIRDPLVHPCRLPPPRRWGRALAAAMLVPAPPAIATNTMRIERDDEKHETAPGAVEERTYGAESLREAWRV